MIVLRRTPYDLNSANGSVQACLRRKREIARPRAEGGIAGIGAESCCSHVTFLDRAGRPDNVFGNSRIRVPYRTMAVRGLDVPEVRAACVHGELTALWNALGDVDAIPRVLEMYVELSPCPRCHAALNAILPGQEVLFSFRHPDEVPQWKAAAKRLCA